MVALGQTQFFKKLYDETLADLPASEIAHDAVASALGGGTAIVTAETGAGKTLICSSLFADQSEGQTLVLVPRRDLAENAARAVASISGCTLGKEVGFAYGRKDGRNESKWNPKNTKLVFATYDYAISSGMINRFDNIMLDEVHEAEMNMSLTKAILHKRKRDGDRVNIIESSATLDATRAAEYWSDVSTTKIYEAKGRQFPITHKPVKTSEKTEAQSIIDLIQNDDRKGVLSFKAGKGEIDTLKEELEKLRDKILEKAEIRATQAYKAELNGAKLDKKELSARIRKAQEETKLLDLEIDTIHSARSTKEKRAALSPPKKWKMDAHEASNPKILIGTNIIESGMNIEWADATHSSGKGKITSYDIETGAQGLELVDLPQWRLKQQEGRGARFRPSINVLWSDTSFEARDERVKPEIERAPLTTIILATLSKGLDPRELKYDADIDIDQLTIAQQRLQKLGLVTEDWQLTSSGRFASRLQVSPESGAMLWRAKELGVLRDAIGMIAVREHQNGIRGDWKSGHGFENSSDVIDGAMAFQELRREQTRLYDIKKNELNKTPEKELKQMNYKRRGQIRQYNARVEKRYNKAVNKLRDECNIGKKAFRETKDIYNSVRRSLSWDLKQEVARDATLDELKETLLYGSVNRIFAREKTVTKRVKNPRYIYGGNEPPYLYKHRQVDDDFTESDLEEGERLYVSHVRKGKDDEESYAFGKSSLLLPEDPESRFVIGDLRSINPDFTIIQNMTSASPDLLVKLSRERPDLFELSFEREFSGNDTVTLAFKDSFSSPISFDVSEVSRRLIDPEYTRFRVGEELELLADKLGIDEDDKATLLRGSNTLNQALRKITDKMGFPVRLIIDKPVQDDKVRLGSINVMRNASFQKVHLDVGDHSLTAEDMLGLFNKFPEVLQNEYLFSEEDQAHAFELEGGKLIVHTANQRLWENGFGSIHLNSKLSLAMKEGQQVVFQDAVAVDLTDVAALEETYFPDLQDDPCPYTEQQTQQIRSVIEEYMKNVQSLDIMDAPAKKEDETVEEEKTVVLIPQRHKEAHAALLQKIQDVKTAISTERSQNLAMFQSVKSSLNSSLFESITIGKETEFSEASYQHMRDKRFPGQVRCALEMHRKIEEVSTGCQQAKILQASFNQRGGIRFTVELDGMSVKERDKARREIEAFGNEKHWNISTRNNPDTENTVTVSFLPINLLSHQEPVCDAQPQLDLINQLLDEHHTRLNAIREAKSAELKIKRQPYYGMVEYLEAADLGTVKIAGKDHYTKAGFAACNGNIMDRQIKQVCLVRALVELHAGTDLKISPVEFDLESLHRSKLTLKVEGETSSLQMDQLVRKVQEAAQMQKVNISVVPDYEKGELSFNILPPVLTKPPAPKANPLEGVGEVIEKYQKLRVAIAEKFQKDIPDFRRNVGSQDMQANKVHQRQEMQ